MVSIELSFLEKLGWLLKEAKEPQNFGQRRAKREGKKSAKSHSGRQDVIAST